MFDDFLTRLSKIEPAIPIFIISGNHDSAQRLDYASRLLGSHQIYIAGKAPETEEEHLRKITLQDEYGEVHFWLLPFLKPGYVRGLCGGGARTPPAPHGLPGAAARPRGLRCEIARGYGGGGVTAGRRNGPNPRGGDGAPRGQRRIVRGQRGVRAEPCVGSFSGTKSAAPNGERSGGVVGGAGRARRGLFGAPKWGRTEINAG